MLKQIDPLLSPQLLYVLCAMGHGDEIAIVDGNYPADGAGPEVVRLDGHATPRVLEAILSVMPLDDSIPAPAVRMEAADDAARIEPIMEEFAMVMARHEPGASMSSLGRFIFCDRVRHAYAIVATGERRSSGNILLRKGVIRSCGM